MPCPLPQAVRHASLRSAIQPVQQAGPTQPPINHGRQCACVQAAVLAARRGRTGAQAVRPAPAPSPPRRGQPSMRQHWQITNERPASALARLAPRNPGRVPPAGGSAALANAACRHMRARPGLHSKSSRRIHGPQPRGPARPRGCIRRWAYYSACAQKTSCTQAAKALHPPPAQHAVP